MNKDFKILIIDDEEQLKNLLQKILMLEGFDVITAGSREEGINLALKDDVGVIITDVKLPDGNGIEITEEIKKKHRDTEVIVLTAYGQISDGVTAMKAGAFDYLIKGDDDEKLPLVVKNAYEKARANRHLVYLKDKIEEKFSFKRISGKSKKINEAIELAIKVAPTETTVLLMGETGTGKELFAQAIHNSSKRKDKKFIAINCSAIPKDLQESELFGYKKGAFTGAVNDKKGYFEEANGGTIFLDEVGDMSLETQSKLLRTLENRTYTKVGDTKENNLDIRVIAATNKDLEEEIKLNRFRIDLYYRLSTFTINLPSLRERIDDIEILVMNFINYYSEKAGKNIKSASVDFIEELKKHPFEGNIRELKNIIERAVILCDSDEINKSMLPKEFNEKSSFHTSPDTTLSSLEKDYILKILKENGGNKSKTAKILGIGTVTLYRKLKEFGME